MKNNQLYPHTLLSLGVGLHKKELKPPLAIATKLRGIREGVGIYLGSTNDLRRRLAEHNSGLSSYTKKYKPYEVIYYEAYKNETDVRSRESNLKLRANAYNQLKRRIVASLKAN